MPLPPCHQYRDFLDPSEHQALLDWTIANRARFGPARLAGRIVDPERRVAERLDDLGPHRALFERRLAQHLPDIFRRTGTRPFEVEFIELELAAHGDGAFFTDHVDIPIGSGRQPIGGDSSGTQDRLVSAVYYFHREPKHFTGGTLRLYRFDDPTASGDFIEFEPEQNSLVVFPSWARHEVRRVGCPGCGFEDYRFAVNAWLCRTRAPPP
jgi:Rps23 Pro-64 3,4-dihydroxylase Tpa1-like proline 4-hydroxylase